MPTRQRSPNYPSVDLGTAVEAAKSLYQREGRGPVPPAVAVKAWGFTGLSGNARTRLAAVRQYGLIESDGKDNVRLTPRGLNLAVASPSSPEYLQVLHEAALAPDIFRELHETRQGASDDSLRHYLIVGRKFSTDGASRLIESYRSTIKLANLENRSYDAGMDDTSANGLDGHTDDGSPAGQSDGGSTGKPPMQNVAQYSWPLYEDVVAEVTFHGRQVTPDDIDLLTAYLDIVKRSRGRTTAPNPLATPPPFSDGQNDSEPGDQ